LEKLRSRPLAQRAIPEITRDAPEAEFIRTHLRSAANLYQAELEPQTFLPVLGQDGYIVQGETHILAASPKVGKTALLFDCVMDWLEDDRTVLWFSEESDRVWAQRLQRLGPGMFDELGYSTHPQANGFI